MGERPGLVSLCERPADSKRVFAVEANGLGVRRLSFSFEGDVLRFELVDDRATHTLNVGIEQWVTGTTNMPGRALHHGYEFKDAQVVAGARWLDGKTLEMTWIYPQTAFRDRVVCEFDGERVSFARTVNVNSAEKGQEVLVGFSVGGGLSGRRNAAMASPRSI